MEKLFEHSILNLAQHDLLDLSVVHGDGSTHGVKKVGDNVGYSGHKHFKAEKVVTLVDRNLNVVAPLILTAGNIHDSPLFAHAFDGLKKTVRELKLSLKSSILSLDSAYDSFRNRKMIYNAGMVPNIKENPRNRKKTKRGQKRFFSEAIFQERFRTVERVFAWEDKFKRLLL